MTNIPDRRPHAGFEQTGRLEKAAKIAALLERRRSIDGSSLLEIGCGSGYMAADFARRVGPSGRVEAVDRYDQRQTTEGFNFTPVGATTLPFEDGSFDLVISNHVLEHVGEQPDQVHHLTEIGRVLRPDGLAYVSVPNRWRPVEPHYHLPLLSWFPNRVSSRYVRLAGKGDWYDVVPPSHRTMRDLFDAAGFWSEDVTLESMEVMAEVESLTKLEAMTLRVPRPLLRAGWWFVPSMIYLAAPR